MRDEPRDADICAQSFAAKEQAHPLLPEHQAAARTVLGALPATFPEARIRDVSKEVVALF